MTVDERRRKIIKILCLRGHETITNLADELGVSERTILRDICALSDKEPIYTQTGRYSGGVYIMPEYYPSSFYFKETELKLLSRVVIILESYIEDERIVEVLIPLKELIATYTKPKYKEGLLK